MRKSAAPQCYVTRTSLIVLFLSSPILQNYKLQLLDDHTHRNINNQLSHNSNLLITVFPVPLHYSPYVGLGIPKVSWSVSVHSVVSDQITDRTIFFSILMWLPEPSGRQSGNLGEKWPLNLAYGHYWLITVTFMLKIGESFNHTVRWQCMS
jgi:hypothetical protein